jgi:hypothetical protein
VNRFKSGCLKESDPFWRKIHIRQQFEQAHAGSSGSSASSKRQAA